MGDSGCQCKLGRRTIELSRTGFPGSRGRADRPLVWWSPDEAVRLCCGAANISFQRSGWESSFGVGDQVNRSRVARCNHSLPAARQRIVGLTLVMATRTVRPLAKPLGPITSVLLGSLPNFGAGLALPFVATNLPRLLGRRPVVSRLRFGGVCAGVFALLAFWEYVQLIVWGYPFDPNDVVGSGVGTTLAALIAGWRRRLTAGRGGWRRGNGAA